MQIEARNNNLHFEQIVDLHKNIDFDQRIGKKIHKFKKKNSKIFFDCCFWDYLIDLYSYN